MAKDGKKCPGSGKKVAWNDAIVETGGPEQIGCPKCGRSFEVSFGKRRIPEHKGSEKKF